MKIKTPAQTISTIAAVALLSLAFFNCGEEAVGPPHLDHKLDPTALKDSADTAQYMHSLYKGKWKPLKWVVVQPGVDTTDKTKEIEFCLYMDTTYFCEIPNQASTIDDTLRYRVTRDSICVSTYGGNFLDWSCTSHAFKDNNTRDYSDSLNTEIWVRTN